MVDKNTDPKDDKNSPVETNPKDDAVEVDTKPIIDEVVTQVTKDFEKKLPDTSKIADDVRDGIIDKLTGDKDKESQSPWKKEGRAPTGYDEVANWGKTQAKKELTEEFEAKEKVKVEKEEKAKKVEVKRQKDWNTYWDGQIDKLVEEGKIPSPTDEIKSKLAENKPLTDDEKDDPGIKARADIHRMASENKETNLELVYYKHFSKKAVKPAGATAPVIGSRKAVTPSGQEEEFSYEEIHGARTMSDLLPNK